MPCHELLNVAGQRLRVTRPKEMISAGILDVFRVRDLRSKIPTSFNGDKRVGSTVKHQGWNTYRWKNQPDINHPNQGHIGFDGARTGRKPLKLGDLVDRVRIRSFIRVQTLDHCSGAPER